MQVTFLGQAGVLLETDSGTKIMIDPYLSDSLREKGGADYTRKIPIDHRFLETPPDILILTHSHGDHMDFASIAPLLAGEPISVLAPLNVWETVRHQFGGAHNYIQFDHGIEVTLHNVLLQSVYAAHSDERAIGVLATADETTVYHTGDTLYSRKLLDWIDRPVDLMLLPINGQGNNMNAVDAARLVRRIAPDVAIPIHWDMFEPFGCDPQAFFDLFPKDTATRCCLAEHYRPIPVLCKEKERGERN